MSHSAARRLPAAQHRHVSTTRRHQHRAAFFFLLPGCALFCLCVVYPIISSISLSFYNWDGMTPKTFAGFDNYIELFHSDTFYTALKNNLIWLAFFLLAPPLGLAFALYLNQQMRGMRVVKSLFFAPFVLSGVVVGLVFSWFYDPTFGLLRLFVGHGIPVLGDPQLRPATFMAVVLTVIGALRSFDLIAVMSGGGPFDSSTVLAYYMYDQAIKYYREGYSAAIAVVLFAIMLVYIVFHLRRMLREER
jgi:multiple sugar transport system permease protein